jgi:hypothetical protein
MKFVSVRELRNSPGKVWKRLENDDLVVTANGKPVGLLLEVDEGSFERTLAAVRRARGLLALSEIRARAAAAGSARLPAGAIAREIAAVRRQRAR